MAGPIDFFEHYTCKSARNYTGYCDEEAEKLIGEIEKLFPQVQQIVASSDFGRDAIEKAKTIVDKARAAIEKRDAAAVKEQIEGLTRTHRMFKGVVAKT